MHWIDNLVASNAESEAPSRFFYWAGVSAISAVIKKNVFLNRHDYRLYPNTYVFLVAASGMKKGVPIKVAKTLVEEADCTRVISGRNSIQQVMADLSKLTIIQGEQTKNAHAILLSGELAAFLTKDNDSLTILTDLHDTHYNEKDWKYSLRSGVSRLIAPCITLLGATNEDHFDEAVPPTQISGGFIARTFIVYSNVPGNYNSLTRAPNRTMETSDFVPHLVEISKLKGEIMWSPEAIEAYDVWYYPFVRSIVDDKTGTERRLGDQVLKLAMIICLASGSDMILRAEHINEAIKEATICARSVKRVTQGSGKGLMTRPITIILKELLSSGDHTRTRKWFLRRFWNEGLTQPEFDVSMESFMASGAVLVTGSNENIVYFLKDEVADEYGKQEKILREG